MCNKQKVDFVGKMVQYRIILHISRHDNREHSGYISRQLLTDILKLLILPNILLKFRDFDEVIQGTFGNFSFGYFSPESPKIHKRVPGEAKNVYWGTGLICL